MLTGAAPQLADGFLASPSRRRQGPGATAAAPSTRMTLALAVAGLAAGGALASSCGRSHPAAPTAADATATAPRPAAAPEAPPPVPQRGKQIAIGYSSNLLGEYEPCG